MPIIETRGSLSSRGYGQFAQSAAPAPAGAYIEDVFSTWLYTGNGSTQTITNGIDLATKGGLVWIKCISSAFAHSLFDTARGTTVRLDTASTAAQAANGGTIAFNANGFTTPNNESTSSRLNETYASWTFAQQPKFFDIVTFTSEEGGALTFNHSLGSQPGCVIVKTTGTAQNWLVYHRDLVSSGTTVGVMNLNATSAVTSTAGTSWNAIATTTTFRVPSGLVDNQPYVAYLFAHNAGGFGASGTDNVISCGSVVTTGSGPWDVNLGWEPQFVIIKKSSGTGNWNMSDVLRGMSFSNPSFLYSNLAAAEGTSSGAIIYPTSTGFQITSSGFDTSSTYIYIAIRRGPMRTPTSGTSVYSVFADGATTNPKTFSVGFPTDFIISQRRGTGASSFNQSGSRLTGNPQYLVPQTSDAEQNDPAPIWRFDQQNSLTQNISAASMVSWLFRRAPGFFDVVCYTGTGVARTVNHNLGVVPEMMIVKTRSGSGLGWYVYSTGLGPTKMNQLNQDGGSFTSSSYWNDTAPTSSVFSLGDNVGTNGSGNTQVAYLFASCPGVSKVGSYTGTGSTVQVDCGFTAGARFVLIKRTDASGSWYVWDSARGIIAGNDPYLLLNSTAAEVTNTDWVDTLSTGFEVSNAGSNLVNVNGGTYIFLAIA